MATAIELFRLGNDFGTMNGHLVTENWRRAELTLDEMKDALHMKFGVNFKAGGAADKLGRAIKAHNQRQAITWQSNFWGEIIKLLNGKEIVGSR